MSRIEIVTPRLVIGDHHPEDLPAMHRLLSDPQTMRFLPDIHTRTLEDSRANLEEALRQATEPGRIKWFFKVVVRESGTYAGEIGYTVTGPFSGGLSAHFGYFLLPEHHGRGYATEASRAVLDYAFKTGGITRITTGCDIRNRASERIMIKLGMTKTEETETRLEYRIDKHEWQRGL